jgi:integrase
MAGKDTRKLEKTRTPGVFRRHKNGCTGGKKCKCEYVVRWWAQGRQRKQLFDTEKEAREFKGGLDSGKTTRRPQTSQTIEGYYGAWQTSYRGRTTRGVDESTMREYKTSFRLHVLPLIGRKRMRDLAAPDFQEWFEKLERRGRSPRTIKHAKIALSVMLACAYEDGEISSNPAVGVRYIPTRAVKAKHAKPPAKELTTADIRAILNAMADAWQAFFFVLAQTGVRVGELLGLVWGRVHLGDDPHILVVEQVYRGRRKPLKTDASEARVPLSSAAAAWLTELRPEGVRPDAPVFPSKTGGPLSYANVYNRILRPALAQAGVAIKVGEGKKGVPMFDYRGVAFHAFRHACATLLHADGKTAAQSKAWLRHSQLTTTMNTYTGLADQDLGSADFFDDVLDIEAIRRGGVGPQMGPQQPRREVQTRPRQE